MSNILRHKITRSLNCCIFKPSTVQQFEREFIVFHNSYLAKEKHEETHKKSAGRTDKRSTKMGI